MRKCERCGKELANNAKKCDVCNFILPKIKDVKIKETPKEEEHPSNLTDYPLLTFVFGLLSLLLPIYIFSFLSIKMSKKQYKESLSQVRNFGVVLAYFGLLVSTFVVVFILFTLLQK